MVLSKKIIWLFSLILMISAFVLTSCGTKSAIIGKWESTDPPGESIEFFSDGTFAQTSSIGITSSGNYSLVDNETMKLDFTGFMGLIGTQIAKVQISGNKLTLTLNSQSFSYTKE